MQVKDQTTKTLEENPFKGRPAKSYHEIVAMIRHINSSSKVIKKPDSKVFLKGTEIGSTKSDHETQSASDNQEIKPEKAWLRANKS